MEEQFSGIKVAHIVCEYGKTDSFEKWVQDFFDQHPERKLVDFKYSITTHPTTNQYIGKTVYGVLILYREPIKTTENKVNV